MAQLVVELPAPDAGVVAITLAEFFHDFADVFAIDVRTPTRLLSGAMPHRPPGGVHHENLRMFLREPDRRGGARRAENHFQALSGAEFDVAVQPGEIKLAFLRFHERPGELAHVDEFQVHFFDVGDVARPFVRRPRFRVIINADPHEIGLGKQRAVGGGKLDGG